MGLVLVLVLLLRMVLVLDPTLNFVVYEMKLVDLEPF